MRICIIIKFKLRVVNLRVLRLFKRLAQILEFDTPCNYEERLSLVLSYIAFISNKRGVLFLCQLVHHPPLRIRLKRIFCHSGEYQASARAVFILFTSIVCTLFVVSDIVTTET